MNIKRIRKNVTRTGYEYKIDYTNGHTRTVKENEDLPLTALNVVLTGKCETRYFENGKVETYRP